MAKKKTATKKAKTAGGQAPTLPGMEVVRNLDLDGAISDRIKALARQKRAKEEADGFLDKIGNLMLATTPVTYRYTYEGYEATMKEGKAEIKVKKVPKSTVAK